MVKPKLDSARVMEVDGSHFLSKISFGIVVLFINHRFGVESSGTQCFTFILEFVTPLPHTCIITLCPLAKLDLHTYRQTITYTHTHTQNSKRKSVSLTQTPVAEYCLSLLGLLLSIGG